MHQRELVVRPQLEYSSQYNPCPKCKRLKQAKAKLCWNCRYGRPEIQQPKDPTIRHIALTKGQIAIVDTEEYAAYERNRWCAMWSEDTESYYAVRGAVRNGRRMTILMHREIVGAGPNDIVDHENHDTLDNRKFNLRKATDSQSQFNKLLQKNNASGWIGVRWDKKTQRWVASLSVDHEKVGVGSYENEMEAVKMRDLAALKLRGEFAILNLPRDTYGDVAMEPLKPKVHSHKFSDVGFCIVCGNGRCVTVKSDGKRCGNVIQYSATGMCGRHHTPQRKKP